MKRLTLLRHAKAHANAGSDHQRPLSPRGRAQCELMARRLAAALPPPDRILLSNARRAVETVAFIRAALPTALEYPRDECDERLYLADAATIYSIASAALTTCTHLWICAHNPGISASAAQLGGSAMVDLPTLGVVHLLVNDDLTGGEVVYFDTPKAGDDQT